MTISFIRKTVIEYRGTAAPAYCWIMGNLKLWMHIALVQGFVPAACDVMRLAIPVNIICSAADVQRQMPDERWRESRPQQWQAAKSAAHPPPMSQRPDLPCCCPADDLGETRDEPAAQPVAVPLTRVLPYGRGDHHGRQSRQRQRR